MLQINALASWVIHLCLLRCVRIYFHLSSFVCYAIVAYYWQKDVYYKLERMVASDPGKLQLAIYVKLITLPLSSQGIHLPSGESSALIFHPLVLLPPECPRVSWATQITLQIPQCSSFDKSTSVTPQDRGM